MVMRQEINEIHKLIIKWTAIIQLSSVGIQKLANVSAKLSKFPANYKLIELKLKRSKRFVNFSVENI